MNRRLLTALVLLVVGCSSRNAPESRPDSDAGTDTAEHDAHPETSTDGADEQTSDTAGPPCALGDVRSCYEGDPEHEDVGECDRGVEECVIIDGGYAWSECLGWVAAAEETCGNGLDEDCDDHVDEEPDGSDCERDNSDCWEAGNEICTNGSCGSGYEPCWEGGCLDPPAGNCCSYHYSTTGHHPGGGSEPTGVNYCD